MKFSLEQIQLAISFKSAGLEWVPSVGDYVFDVEKILPYASPFQHGVYCLVDYDCFMRHAGGERRFREKMVWLPTWSGARQILRECGVDERGVAERLRRDRAIEQDAELLSLYQMIVECLESRSAAMFAAPHTGHQCRR